MSQKFCSSITKQGKTKMCLLPVSSTHASPTIDSIEKKARGHQFLPQKSCRWCFWSNVAAVQCSLCFASIASGGLGQHFGYCNNKLVDYLQKENRIHGIAKAIHSETDGWITKFINRNCASSCSCTAVCASRCANKTEEVSWEQLSQQFCVSLQTLVKIYLWPLQHWTNIAVVVFLFFYRQFTPSKHIGH